ncbi:MAG TPA: hypothetical protein VNJ53_03575 [Gaiellaceae bacterium]|nr:hypothetical protein [Gaiellaceae bacterium]
MQVTIARRFRGPSTSANGGYASGLLARVLKAETVEVTLRRPPPLERPLEARVEDGRAVLLDGGELVAEARPAELELDVPAPPTVEEAERAAARHVRAGDPVFAECFVCGVRAEDDGLGVYAGAVPGREPLHAAPWRVREVSPELVWAAIDCPGAYAVGAAGRGEVVLGRMTARVAALPEPGETCVVVSWPLGEEGRKLFAGTALFSAGGELLACARQVWIEPRGVSATSSPPSSS